MITNNLNHEYLKILIYILQKHHFYKLLLQPSLKISQQSIIPDMLVHKLSFEN